MVAMLAKLQRAKKNAALTSCAIGMQTDDLYTNANSTLNSADNIEHKLASMAANRGHSLMEERMALYQAQTEKRYREELSAELGHLKTIERNKIAAEEAAK